MGWPFGPSVDGDRRHQPLRAFNSPEPARARWVIWDVAGSIIGGEWTVDACGLDQPSAMAQTSSTTPEAQTTRADCRDAEQPKQ